MNKLYLLAIVVVISFAGIIFLSNSMTGNIVLDEHTKAVCSSNSDCTNPDVCCPFSGQTSGVCNAQTECAVISQLTTAKEAVIEKPTTVQDNSGAKLLGYTIIVLAIIGIIVVLYVKFGSTKTKKIKQKNIVRKKVSHMKFDKDKTGIYIVAIVGIVAIIAIFILVFSGHTTTGTDNTGAAMAGYSSCMAGCDYSVSQWGTATQQQQLGQLCGSCCQGGNLNYCFQTFGWGTAK